MHYTVFFFIFNMCVYRQLRKLLGAAFLTSFFFLSTISFLSCCCIDADAWETKASREEKVDKKKKKVIIRKPFTGALRDGSPEFPARAKIK